MDLVIVESPSKAKTIKKYLGKGFEVKASKGHVVDLPKSKLGVDVEKNFEPKYVVTKKKALSDLKKAYKGKERLILAVDLDREGEAIGWHVAQKLGVINKDGTPKNNQKVERIVFSEITKDAIKEAIKQPRSIDMDLVDAQQARRILDRLVGYKLSPLIWKKISYGLSAGRVQSVAVRLIVEREEERRKFKAEEYWSLESYVDKSKEDKVQIFYSDKDKGKIDKLTNSLLKSDKFKFELFKVDKKKPDLKNKKSVEKIIKDIQGKDWKVADLEKKVKNRYPRTPFITSTLQRSAVNRLGFTAQRTMRAAQKLYEAGLITYMRTDSVNISENAIKQAREYLKKKFDKNYLPSKPKFYKTKSKNAQEAHECIRPVDFKQEPDKLKLSVDEKKIYDLIWRRSLACQMNPAKIENMSIIVNIDKYQFKSTGSRVVFDGFLKIYPERVNENILSEIEKGIQVYPELVAGIQHFTQPPGRYSEASLIKKLEDLGIGRPSTYASIISTIQKRRYVEKEGRYLFPTTTGEVVNKLLVKYFPKIVDYGFTAKMEDELDEIAEGKMDWVKMMKGFYGPFEKNLEKQDKNIDRSEFTVLGESDEKCPECGSEMIIKLGRYGKFLSCTNYPDCKGMKSLEEERKTKEGINIEDKEEFEDTYQPAPETDDGKKYELKKGRYGYFWSHPDYPKVKDIKPLKLKKDKMEEKYGEPPKTDDGRDYVLKSGRFGPFWSHPDYPKVKDIKKVEKK